MPKLSIKQKLMLVLTIVPVLLVGMGIFSNAKFGQMEQGVAEIIATSEQTAESSVKLTELMDGLIQAAQEFLYTGRPAPYSDAKEHIRELQAFVGDDPQFSKTLEAYDEVLDIIKIRFDSINRQRSDFQKARAQILQLIGQAEGVDTARLFAIVDTLTRDINRPDKDKSAQLEKEAYAFIDTLSGEIQIALEDMVDIWYGSNSVYFKLQQEVNSKIAQYNKELERARQAWIEARKEAMSSTGARIKAMVKQTNISILTLCAIALVVGVIGNLYVKTGVIRPLTELIEKTKELATGEADLTRNIPVPKMNCSKMMECDKTDCTCYGKEANCWMDAGSFHPEPQCPKIVTGEYEDCSECEVYKRALVNETDQIAFYFNRFIFRIRQLISTVAQQGELVASQSVQLRQISENMDRAAKEIQETANNLGSTAEHTMSKFAAVATAMEELSSTINEIANHTTTSNEVTMQASELAGQSHGVIAELYKSSDRISEMGNLISSIAEQTNLLALNATIEAARAGEAGKGFAVVAGEVKDLAKQTNNSVDEINQLVSSVKEQAMNALNAIDSIVNVMKEVHEMAANVALAVEQQTATTIEVTSNVQEVNQEASSINDACVSMIETGNQNLEHVKRLRDGAETLDQLADGLKKVLSQFKV